MSARPHRWSKIQFTATVIVLCGVFDQQLQQQNASIHTRWRFIHWFSVYTCFMLQAHPSIHPSIHPYVPTIRHIPSFIPYGFFPLKKGAQFQGDHRRGVQAASHAKYDVTYGHHSGVTYSGVTTATRVLCRHALAVVTPRCDVLLFVVNDVSKFVTFYQSFRRRRSNWLMPHCRGATAAVAIESDDVVGGLDLDRPWTAALQQIDTMSAGGAIQRWHPPRQWTQVIRHPQFRIVSQSTGELRASRVVQG